MEQKFRLPRKILTIAEAKTKKQNCICQIFNLQEEILYWEVRKNKPLDPIDNFIIMADKTVKSPQEIIDRNWKQIEEKTFRIENYFNKIINAVPQSENVQVLLSVAAFEILKFK